MVVLGGMGSVSGSVLAAIVLTLLPEVLRPVKDYRMVIYSLMLIVLMITRPQGLLGHPRAVAGRGSCGGAGRPRERGVSAPTCCCSSSSVTMQFGGLKAVCRPRPRGRRAASWSA